MSKKQFLKSLDFVKANIYNIKKRKPLKFNINNTYLVYNYINRPFS